LSDMVSRCLWLIIVPSHCVFATDHPVDTACAPDIFVAYNTDYYPPDFHFLCDP